MNYSEILITFGIGVIVLVFIGGFVRRRNRRIQEARSWHGTNIRLLTMIINRTEEKLESNRSLDPIEVIDDIKPISDDISTLLQDIGE